MSKKKIMSLMEEYGISPKTDLDQHFCIDKNLANELIKLLELKKGDIVYEIGPGLGFVTKELVKNKGIKIKIIELDENLIPLLENNFLKEDVEIIHANALKINYPKKAKIVSNLPFNLAEPLLNKLRKIDFERIVLVVSEGFSKKFEKLRNLNNGFKFELFNSYPRESYYPKPRTDSRVIRLKKKNLN